VVKGGDLEPDGQALLARHVRVLEHLLGSYRHDLEMLERVDQIEPFHQGLVVDPPEQDLDADVAARDDPERREEEPAQDNEDPERREDRADTAHLLALPRGNLGHDPRNGAADQDKDAADDDRGDHQGHGGLLNAPSWATGLPRPPRGRTR
jgi:hypothetical protein